MIPAVFSIYVEFQQNRHILLVTRSIMCCSCTLDLQYRGSVAMLLMELNGSSRVHSSTCGRADCTSSVESRQHGTGTAVLKSQVLVVCQLNITAQLSSLTSLYFNCTPNLVALWPCHITSSSHRSPVVLRQPRISCKQPDHASQHTLP